MVRGRNLQIKFWFSCWWLTKCEENNKNPNTDHSNQTDISVRQSSGKLQKKREMRQDDRSPTGNRASPPSGGNLDYTGASYL